MSMTVLRRVICVLALAAILMPAAGHGYQAPLASTQSEEPEVETAAVEIDGRVLFVVRGTTSYPATQRAEAIEARIEALARDPKIGPDSIVLTPFTGGLEIGTGGTRLMRVVDADALLESVQLEILAERHLEQIREAVSRHRVDRAPRKLLQGAAWSLLATLGFALVMVGLRGGFRRLVAWLEARLRARVETMPAGHFQFVQGRQLLEAATATVHGVRWIGFLLILYAWLQFVLIQFPWTRPLGEDLFDLVVEPLSQMGNGLIEFAPEFLFLLVLLVITRYGLRLIKAYCAALERGSIRLDQFEPEWAMPAYKIVRTLVVGLAIVIAYPYLPGSGTEALKGLSIFAGLLVSLGASGAVSNVIAGYFNTFGRVFRVGDFIEVGDVRGHVTHVRLLTTRLRTVKNEEVTLPNATIITNRLTNYSALAKQRGLILHTEVGIGYEVPWRQVHAMLEEAARRVARVLETPPPWVLQRRLADFAVVYELNAAVESPDGMGENYSLLHQSILDVFNEHGVQIMTPAYESDPGMPKIVAPDQWYLAPAPPPVKAEPLRDPG